MGTQRDVGFLRRLAQRLITPTRLNVLMIDPDTSGAQRTASALASRHKVTVVGTSADAYTAIQQHVPMFVVTEVDLPDASVLELLSTLRSAQATREVLLVVLTKRSDVQNKVAALRAGADDYLVKPVEPEVFAAHIERLNHFRIALKPTSSF